jgi:hypothetical protein
MSLPAWLDPPHAAGIVPRIPRPTRPSAGDVAQAQLFDEILRTELAELEDLALTVEARAASRALQRRHKELSSVNARIREVRRMLSALDERFPAV